ncbi:hypothetical protein QAD02_015064 [Eretmocerus hayati]|uniref:Uncharacterized protein n=1 Tax=Eretmocerus hayati TaxID=131215 RepID=A0ACC2P756_9HYME|nr:hypothetical protein QAD02_015064 [Eretmocerus hayati]
MLKFNKDLSISHLPLDIYEDIVVELDANCNWKILAQHVCEKIDYSSSWINTLHSKVGSASETPARNLLVELNIKLCTVEILSTLLENCNLLKALSILHYPEPLNIIAHPDQNLNGDSLSVEFGQSLHLECKAYGLPPPSYQWYHDDEKLEGQVSDKLSVPVTLVSQKGLYKCRIYQLNHKGQKLHELFSRAVSVDIKPTPVILTEEPQVYSEVKENECLILKCEATGHPAPQYQWYKNNEKLDSQSSKLLKIEGFSARDEGKYYCHVYNSLSEIFTQKCTILMEVPRQTAVAKIALLIANENYDNQETLRTPKNDVAKVAKILAGLGFDTLCLADLTLVQMKNAIRVFCDSLTEGVYGLFYFAGHGFKMQENYMLSIDAPSTYLRKDAICESQLLSKALKNDPALLVVVLDMCQTSPASECNPKIHKEVPSLNEYKSQKNLRNLLQAYSTSSYRPSYERLGKSYGLYATHLCKYLDQTLPVTKVFELVGKSIDTWLRGAERKQIPMFATTITKPYQLTDSISQKEVPASIQKLKNIMDFSKKVIDISFQQTRIECKAIISPYSKPYLNFVQVSLLDVDEMCEINFYNSVHSKRNNLFQCTAKNKCWIHNPQINQGPLVVSLVRDGVHVGATLLEISKLIPSLLTELESKNLAGF